MQHSGKWNTTSQILKPKNIKLRDINGLTSSQIKKMSVRCRSQAHHAVLDVHIMEIENQGMKLIETLPQRQPADTQAVCDLHANPDDNTQYEINI